ncbi:hypothetical protein RHGRI_012841 [Rhododendron griersonianum]|uniref:Aminopeptidase P N-terminal domain-containing protein n=1 Tax=Rhododendron griersonianum TaxID=479676 RepID=A0AAV6K3A0_9ERIC|nr:hypothetical protein RHGRI_012841 [Rhododendron griersonianum]
MIPNNTPNGGKIEDSEAPKSLSLPFLCLQRNKENEKYTTNLYARAFWEGRSGQTQWIKEGEITPGITIEEYISRRKTILELLPDKSLTIIVAASVKMMTDVVPYTYQQDADYSYIMGYQQPGGVAVLGHDYGLCMFMPEASPEVCSECYAMTLSFVAC